MKRVGIKYDFICLDCTEKIDCRLSEDRWVWYCNNNEHISRITKRKERYIKHPLDDRRYDCVCCGKRDTVVETHLIRPNEERCDDSV